MDRANEAMELTLWSPGADRDGVVLRVAKGKAYGRLDAESDWQEIPNPTDIFAPGGDLLGFLVAAENIQEVESREYEAAEAKNDVDAFTPYSLLPTSYSHYTFDINGPRYATYVRE